MLAHYQSSYEMENFEVWPENWDALQMFLKLRAQWRVSPMGQLIGLDYTAVLAVINFEKSTDKHQLFDDIQTIENGALLGLQEVRQKK